MSPTGRRIQCRRLGAGGAEAFRNYLLQHVLSFSLLARGREPLHASAVAIDRGAVAFLGGCGAGKSTLTAAFLRRGHRLLTDDLLVAEPRDDGYVAQPGLARIKLYANSARAVLARTDAGQPMNPGTAKRIFPLPLRTVAAAAVPLRAICLIRPSRATKDVECQRLSGPQALLALVGGTFNAVAGGHERFRRQFVFARDLAAKVPVSVLSYPRALSALPRVREFILADVV